MKRLRGVNDKKSPKSISCWRWREWAWIKLKKEYSNEFLDTVDLVIVGADYGKGRRVGNYGTFLLVTYNPSEDIFFTICKVGTGFTDQL